MADQSFPLKITLGAIDRATAPLARMQARIARLFAPLEKIGARLRVLSDTAGLPRLGASLERVGSSLLGVGREVSRLALRFGTLAAAGGAAAFALVRSYGLAGDEIAKTARKLGIEVETLQELRFAASREGIEGAAFDKGLELLTRTIGEAALGMGEGRVALQALGVAVVDTAGKVRPFDSLLGEIADKLAAVEDQNLRNAIAAKLFGRSGAEMTKLVALGSGAIGELRAEARRLGLVLSREATDDAEAFSDALDNLKASGVGLRNVFGRVALPWLTRFSDKATEFLVRLQPRAEAFAARFMERLPERLATLQRSFSELLEDARPFLDFLGRVVQRIGPARALLLTLAAVIGGPLLLAIASVAAALVSLGVTLGATPVGWILVLAGLAGVLIANWEKVGPFFEKLFADLKAGWTDFLDWLDPKLVSFFDRLQEFIEGPAAKVGRKVLEILGPSEAQSGAPFQVAPPATPEEQEAKRKAVESIYGVRPRAAAPSPEGRVRVSFENAPPGMRVREDKRGGMPVDLDVGYSMAGHGGR